MVPESLNFHKTRIVLEHKTRIVLVHKIRIVLEWRRMKEGWVRRKVKNSDAWVRRWISLDNETVSSYQSKTEPAMNVLHLRKIRQVKLLKGGTFLIVPYSNSGKHAGYQMRVDTEQEAQAWVNAMNAARRQISSAPPTKSGWCACCFNGVSGDDERRALIVAK